jgi:hypothetical protein
MSFKVCGGSLRRQIALVTRIGFRMPLLAADSPVSYQGIAAAMPQMREIERLFRGRDS